MHIKPDKPQAMMDATTVPAIVIPRDKHRKLAHHVVETLTQDIRNGVLKTGEKLPTESAIMLQFGVSRTVVREAISHLQAAGLVQTRHGIGTFALAPAPTAIGISPATIVTVMDVLSILELRISLETEAAWLAAARRSEAQVEALRTVLARLVKPADPGTTSVDADVEFHLLIAQATGNRYFVDILHHLGTTIIPRARIHPLNLARQDPASYLERVNREHEDIFDAILRQDSEGARAAMRTHLSNSRERLRRAQEALQDGGQR